MKYRYTRKEIIAEINNYMKLQIDNGISSCLMCGMDSKRFKKYILTTKKTKSPNSGGVKSGKTTRKCMLCGLVFSLKSWKECPRCKTLPQPNIQPLNLAHTTTSRPELRQTEKEIMIENKINEIIKYLNK